MPSASRSKLLQVRDSTLTVTEVIGAFPEQGLCQHKVWMNRESACSYSSTSPENFIGWELSQNTNGCNSIELIGLMQFTFWSNNLNSGNATPFLLPASSSINSAQSSMRLVWLPYNSRIWSNEFHKWSQVPSRLLSSKFGPF